MRADYNEAAQKTASEICKRQARLEAKRAPFDLLYDDIDDYVIGRRADYDIGNKQGGAPGAKNGSKIYDLTAAMALQDFVDGYQGNSAAPTINWWKPIFRSKELMKMTDAKVWLDDVYEAITAEINNSNFFSQISEATWDRTTYGYSTIYGPVWSAKKGRLVYYLRHPREVFFSLNAEGDPDLWHRKFMISGRQIMDIWPNAPLKDNFKNKIEKNPYTEYVCIHAVFPRKERDITKIDNMNKEYASIYVLEGEKCILEESGMDADEVPTTARWRLTTEAYPRSAAIDTIYATMMVNAMTKTVLRSAQLMVEPPYVSTSNKKLKIVPSGVTVIENPSDRFDPIQFPSALQVGVAEIADVRRSLGEMFKAKIFSLMSQLTSGNMTATQTMAMQGEQATLLQPIVTRDQNENLIPLIRKTFKVLAKAGRIPTPPPSLVSFSNTPVDIAFSGPVAMLAKRYLQMQGFNATVPQVIALAAQAPQLATMLDRLDPDETYDYIMNTGGAPASISRDIKLVAQIRDQRMREMQAQAQAAKLEQVAGAYNKGAVAPAPGSPSEALMAQK
jgi:hypothetical protein